MAGCLLAQENPYFVTYNHDLEDSGDLAKLELGVSSTIGVPRSGQRAYFAPYSEFEYGVTQRRAGLTLARSPLFCRCGRALAKILAHFVDFERRFARVLLHLFPEQFHPFSGFDRLILFVGEAVGLIVLVTDQLVSTTSHAALQLGSIVVFPVKQATKSGCTTCDSADDSAL
jgi:hypothetical protein